MAFVITAMPPSALPLIHHLQRQGGGQTGDGDRKQRQIIFGIQ
uniref:Uncharacterized protein n=1 Tax=Oryza sativa subsp. japonica TaxID=39947 RepID=Q6AUA0_ORYSJ|nr:hypothetical protein [Oryza sativa Japonica Group]